MERADVSYPVFDAPREILDAWLVPVALGWRRKASTRRLVSAELTQRAGVTFIDARLPHSRATRGYSAGARVRVKAGASEYHGIIERTKHLDGDQVLVIRVAG